MGIKKIYMDEINDLSKKCLPCNGKLSNLSDAEIGQMLINLPKWQNLKNKIYKEFNFQTYMAGIDFCNYIAQVAEKQDHHPDLEVKYKRVNIFLSTHKTDGITLNDIILANKIEAVYNLFFND